MKSSADHHESESCSLVTWCSLMNMQMNLHQPCPTGQHGLIYKSGYAFHAVPSLEVTVLTEETSHD
jgi:hypothetical protein